MTGTPARPCARLAFHSSCEKGSAPLAANADEAVSLVRVRVKATNPNPNRNPNPHPHPNPNPNPKPNPNQRVRGETQPAVARGRLEQ